MDDIRDLIFRNIYDKKFKALLTAEKDGILSGVNEAIKTASDLCIEIEMFYIEGDKISQGDVLAEISGTPKQITMAEDRIIGCLSKYSGISTATARAVALADGKVKIVSGSMKKMPSQMKFSTKIAIESGGGECRISKTPMVYLDKNYIKMLGSIKNALKSVESRTDLVKVVQIKGIEGTIEEETLSAIENGCNILMVDTGNINDVKRCLQVLESYGIRKNFEVAFAGGVKIADIPELCEYGIDSLCIGKEIVDALLLDMKLDVQI